MFGEQRRRQELLRAAGNLASIRDYPRLAADGEELPPLPFLLVIVDEFSELLASRPEFIDLFVAIGRLGRSLGMHLLFASQRLDEGRLRGLESHLSYRIGLRTFSAAESRAVLGVPDAHELPAIPGSAYLKVDPAVFERFKAAMVSDPYRRRDEGEDRPRPAPAARFSAQRRSGGGQTARTFAEHPDGEGRSASVMDVAVARLAPAAPRVHQVWLPPLAPAIPLDRLLRIVEPGEAGGLLAPGWSPAARLRVPLGVLDRPQDQLQVPLVADFAGATGHLAVVGSPQSGKSTLLRTLVASFILSHRPEEAQFYCVDLGGGTLQAVAGAPHVGSVTGRHDPERVRRVIGTVLALLDDREQLFLAKGIDSVQTFRALRDRGQLEGDDLGDVFLVLDNWAAIRQEFEDLEPVVVDLAARGLGYGIHLVVAANRWLDIRPNLRDSIGGRVELRLADPLDSEIGRKEAANVPVWACPAAASPWTGCTSRPPCPASTARPTRPGSRRRWRTWSAGSRRPSAAPRSARSTCCRPACATTSCRRPPRTPSPACPSGSPRRTWPRSTWTCAGPTPTWSCSATASRARPPCCAPSSAA